MMETDLTTVENALKVRLRAYQPKPEFVDNLKQRLTSPPAIEIENAGSNTKTFMVAGSVIFIFALFFWLISQFTGKKKSTTP
jgi:hypothetical protein